MSHQQIGGVGDGGPEVVGLGVFVAERPGGRAVGVRTAEDAEADLLLVSLLLLAREAEVHGFGLVGQVGNPVCALDHGADGSWVLRALIMHLCKLRGRKVGVERDIVVAGDDDLGGKLALGLQPGELALQLEVRALVG